MSPNKKILFWPGWWYPNPWDPLEGIFIKKHAEAVSQFCDVCVLYVRSGPQMKSRRYEPEYREETGIPTLRMYYKTPPRIPVIGKLVDTVRYIIAARRGLAFLKETHGPPDVVHVHVNPPVGLVFLLFTRLRGIPYIHTEHWSGYLEASGKYKGLFRKWLTGRFMKRAKTVTPVSENLRAAMEGHRLHARYRVIPNVVDTNLFSIGAQKKKNVPKKRILHVSGLVPLKNVAGIFRVVKRLAAERDDFQLTVVGDGPERAALEKAALEDNLLDIFVYFTGRKSVEEVAQYMKESHFFVLFSDYENSPCVIVEAMASGLPVIAVHVGGIPELVNEGTGIL
ncbi:MAG: glycosyltransferase family 4 protein, partial [bacterium]|nr:glycosyltransferase family 4 protein [bacterium]